MRLWPLLSPGGILVYATCSVLEGGEPATGPNVCWSDMNGSKSLSMKTAGSGVFTGTSDPARRDGSRRLLSLCCAPVAGLSRKAWQHLADRSHAVVEWTDELMMIAGVDWTPSEAVIEALDHGVVVPVRVTTRQPATMAWHALIAIAITASRFATCRWSKLPDHRNEAGQQQSFPRLGMLLDSMRQSQAWATGLGRAMRRISATGRYRSGPSWIAPDCRRRCACRSGSIPNGGRSATGRPG
jgi:hypothetical protein